MNSSSNEMDGSGHGSSENRAVADALDPRKLRHPLRPTGLDTASGCPRDFLANRFVYVVISPRARGLSVGINVNPDKRCNFDCVYCEVNRRLPGRERALEVDVMAAELQQTLAFVNSGQIRQLPAYCTLPDELLKLRHIALSGDGEPTLCPNFAEAVQAAVHVRALIGFQFFRLVLITNGTALQSPQSQRALGHFTRADEIWIKLDAGTQTYMNKVNRPRDGTLEQVLANILFVGRQRPVIIQSLFPLINHEEPPAEEIDQYAQRLLELKENGAEISLVQIYSASRPGVHAEYGHLFLRSLSRIAQTVRTVTGLKVEVF